MFLQNFSYAKEDIISTDKYFKISERLDNIKYIKTDSLYSINPYLWRNKIQNSLSKNDNSNVIIGHSDYDINEDIYQHYNFKTWFCVNKNVEKENVYSLPLGVTNDCDDSPIHRIFGNTDIFFEVLSTTKKIENLVYLNFNIQNYPSERGLVYNYFKDKDFVTIGKIENTLIGRKNFLKDIYNHKFVLCPRGNGLDTHRLWETLYMKTIPIVKREIYNKDFTDLPILFINKWEEITEEFLHQKYEEIMSKEWNLDKLKISYWEKFISNKISKKLEYVITSCNDNPNYYKFIPYQVKV